MADAFDVGILAEHSRMTAWGPGKVVKVRAPYVWVFFRDAPGRAARQFPASLLVRSSCQTDTVLENLPAFIEKDGVQVLPSERYTLREALDIFHTHAPEGFNDGGVTKAQKDRERRRGAHEAYERTLGGGQAEELLAQDSVGELTTRALAVVALVLRMHDSGGGAGWVAAVLLADAVPIALLSPAAGVLVDRFDTRRLIVVASLAQVGLCTALAFTSSTAAGLRGWPCSERAPRSPGRHGGPWSAGWWCRRQWPRCSGCSRRSPHWRWSPDPRSAGPSWGLTGPGYRCWWTQRRSSP